MTPNEFRKFQQDLGMDAPTFARFLCIGERTLWRIYAGQNDIPPWVQTYAPMIVDMALGRWGQEARDYVLALPRPGANSLPVNPKEIRRPTRK